MIKLTAILLVTSSYFVYGWAVGLADSSIYPDDDLMETLKILARRHPISSHVSGFPEFLRMLQKKSLFDDPVVPIQVHYSVGSEIGEVTLEVSCPMGVDVHWFFRYNHSTIITRGDEEDTDVMVKSTLVVNVDTNRVGLMLFADSSSAVVYFNISSTTQQGVQRILFPNPNIEFPDTAQVSETGEITLDVTLPPASSNMTRPVSIFYTYMNPISEEIDGRELDNYTFSNTEKQITVSNVPEAIEGFLTIFVRNGTDLNKNENTFIRRICAMHNVDITTTGVTYSNATVKIMRGEINYMAINGTIRYGDVSCIAMGHPKPKLSISKLSFDADHKLPHNNVAFRTFMSGAYVSLDGMSITETAGTYVCKAQSGTEKVSKNITMI